MTVFGIVWLMLILFSLAKNKRKMLVTLLLFSSVFQSSNVLIIGSTGNGPQIITSAVVSIYFLLNKARSGSIRVSKRIFTIDKALVLLFAYILFNSVNARTATENVLRILQLMFYILCFFAMKDIGKQLDDDYVYTVLRKLTIFVLIVGVFQILCTTNIIPRYWFIRDIFWNDSVVENSDVVQFMWSHGSYFRFFSTYMEPSYFVGFSVGALFYFFNYKTKRINNYLLITALGIATILSFSSSGYGALLITGIIYLAFSREGKMKVVVLVGGLIGFAVLYFGFYNVLDNVIFSKMSSGSANARLTWNLEAIMAFNNSPIFGVGYKNSRASSMVYTILAELGIVGLILYLNLMISIIKPIINKKRQLKTGDEQVGIIFALIGVMASQIIAVPDIDICTFWMWMNLLGLLIGRNNKRELRT
jgi:hypothetical protein